MDTLEQNNQKKKQYQSYSQFHVKVKVNAPPHKKKFIEGKQQKIKRLNRQFTLEEETTRI